jgi:hypothetical protein
MACERYFENTRHRDFVAAVRANAVLLLSQTCWGGSAARTALAISYARSWRAITARWWA